MLAEHELHLREKKRAEHPLGRSTAAIFAQTGPATAGSFRGSTAVAVGLSLTKRAPERASGPARQLPTDVDSAITDAFAGTDACEQSLSTRNFPIRYLVKGTRKGPRNLGSMTDATSRQRDGAFVRAAAARKS